MIFRQLGVSSYTVGAAIEIALLSLGIYAVLRFLRTTRGFGVLRGLLVFLLAVSIGLAGLDAVLEVPRLNFILGLVAPWLVVVLVILFQPELRRGISQIGRAGFLGFLGSEGPEAATLAKVTAAVQRMAKERIGALIAFERNVSLDPYEENAVKIEAPVASILLEAIFFPGNPLHDGAVILRGRKIAYAVCLFPLTENPEVQRRMGTRHRAALGLTEETDAVTVVVSEETGRISICCGGIMYRQVPFDQIEDKLRELLRTEAPKPKPKKDSAAAETRAEPSSVVVAAAESPLKPPAPEKAASQ